MINFPPQMPSQTPSSSGLKPLLGTKTETNLKPKSADDKTIFRGRDKITMREAVYNITRNTTSGLSRVEGENFSQKERSEIAKKISDFGKFGAILQKSERSRIYRTLAKERQRATPDQRMKIDKQIRFLKKTIGK